jgi:hypothetical protein
LLIESIINRAGGTFVKLGDDIYHFFTHIPGDNRHVCEVEDEDHIQTFLAIKEGYRLVKMPRKPKAEAKAEEAPDVVDELPATEQPAKKAK